jgi:hypothetical protein
MVASFQPLPLTRPKPPLFRRQQKTKKADVPILPAGDSARRLTD